MLHRWCQAMIIKSGKLKMESREATEKLLESYRRLTGQLSYSRPRAMSASLNISCVTWLVTCRWPDLGQTPGEVERGRVTSWLDPKTSREARRSESRWSGIRAKLVVAYTAQGIHKSAQLWGVGITKRSEYQELINRLCPPRADESTITASGLAAEDESQPEHEVLWPQCAAADIKSVMRLVDVQRKPNGPKLFYGEGHRRGFGLCTYLASTIGTAKGNWSALSDRSLQKLRASNLRHAALGSRW